MIPIRSQHKVSRLPIVSAITGVACAAAMVRLSLFPDERAASIVRALAVVPKRLLAAPGDPGQLFTLLAASFMHAGWIHLLGNLLYLAVFGPPAEDRLGHIRFGALYLVSGIAGLGVHVATHPASAVPLVGASAAIAGVLGATIVLLPRTKVTAAVPVLISIEFATLPAAFLVGVWALLQAAAVASTGGTGGATTIAFEAHLGGFAAGVVLSLPAALAGWSKKKRRPKRHRS